MEFEYRWPEIEQALMAAREVETLEAALASAIALQPDLGRPDVYGHKLFAPGLDAAVPTIARRLGLTDTRQAKSNDNVCIVATQLYASGGHSKVAYDISDLIGADRISAIYTDVYGKLKHTDLIGAMSTKTLKRRADVLLGARDLVGKVVELYNILAALRPTRIFMLTHHFDIVAAVALWPFRDVVEFLHHADHVPSIGATLAFSSHVDLTWTCHQACHAAQLAPIYAGMTVRGEREVGVEPRRDAGSPLRIATCGPLAKYRGAASHRWTDYAVAALAARDASLVHIGPVDDDFRAEIAQTLTAAGIDPARYSYTGAVPDLPAALIAERANLYLSSYPVSGGKANLEAMALGLPTVVPVDEGSPPLLQFDFPAATWTRISSPEALRSALQDRSPRDLADAESRAVMSEELARFERQVLDPPRPGSTSD